MIDQPEFDTLWDEAKAHIDHGEYDRAIDIYKYILIRYSDNLKAVEFANACLGDVLLTTGTHIDQAKRHLKKAIELSPDNAHYHYLLGFACSLRKQWARATYFHRKALALDPNNHEYERCLGWAMVNGGEMVKGLDHLNRALDMSPSDVNVLMDLGSAMLMMGDLSMAKQYAEDTLRINPSSEVAKKLLETVNSIGKKLN